MKAHMIKKQGFAICGLCGGRMHIDIEMRDDNIIIHSDCFDCGAKLFDIDLDSFLQEAINKGAVNYA